MIVWCCLSGGTLLRAEELRRYELDPGETIRVLASDAGAERDELVRKHRSLRNVSPGQGVVLYWSDSRNALDDTFSGSPATLGKILKEVYQIPLSALMVQGDQEPLNTPLPGDWVVRTSAGLDMRVEALDRLLHVEPLQSQIKSALGFVPVFRKVDVELPVVVAKGKYSLTPLDPKLSWVHLTSKGTDLSDLFGGGGQGDLDQFLSVLGLLTKNTFINETGDRTEIQWEQHESSVCLPGSDPTAHTESLLKLISQQTGLTFSHENRMTPVWKVLNEVQPPDPGPTGTHETGPSQPESTPVSHNIFWIALLLLTCLVVPYLLKRTRTTK